MTQDVLNEVSNVIKAITVIQYVEDNGTLTPLASESNTSAAYIQNVNISPKLKRTSTLEDGYDMHGYYSVTLNVDCTQDKDEILNVVDAVILGLLNDSPLWSKVVDRNILGVEFDSGEFYPKRSAVMALEVVYRL